MRIQAGVVEQILGEAQALPDVFDQFLLRDIAHIRSDEMSLRKSRNQVINEFLTEALALFREAVVGGRFQDILPYLLNDSIKQFGLEFYNLLPECAWHVPRFYRTDEAASGEIYEIQCPGSGWGDLPLLARVYELIGVTDESKCEAYIQMLTNSICAAAGNDTPTVLHLLDNSSNPSSMRLLMRLTQSRVKYVGHSPGLRSLDAQLIRSHSVQGLVAENLFWTRLDRAAKGLCRFDLPPIMIFDQKVILTLPFMDATRHRFSDSIRNALVYTYPLHESGFRDVDGKWCSVKQFLGRSPKDRRYYLKYAGSDTSLNWGSRAVYALHGSDSAELIERALHDVKRNRPWVIQPSIGRKADVDFFDGRSGALGKGRMSAKLSSFYGPLGLVGVRAQYRKGTKVHGQPDTVCGLIE